MVYVCTCYTTQDCTHTQGRQCGHTAQHLPAPQDELRRQGSLKVTSMPQSPGPRAPEQGLTKPSSSLPAWVSIYTAPEELFLSLPSHLILAIYSNACVWGKPRWPLLWLGVFWAALLSRSDAGPQLGEPSANRMKIARAARP